MKLTDEFKRKLVRDLAKDIRLSEFTFVFQDTDLHCISKKNGTTSIHYANDMPKRCSYTGLLKSVKFYLYEQMVIYDSVRNDLKELSYETLIQNVLVYKRKEQPIDCNCFLVKDNYFFQFTVHTHIFHNTFNEDTDVFITHDVLEAHEVDITTFFNDVADSYMKNGIDILDDSFPTY